MSEWPKRLPQSKHPHVAPDSRAHPTKERVEYFLSERRDSCARCNTPTVWRHYLGPHPWDHGPWICSDECHQEYTVIQALEGACS